MLGSGNEFDLVTSVAPEQDDESARTAFARAVLACNVDIADPITVALRPSRALGSKPAGDMALAALAESSR